MFCSHNSKCGLRGQIRSVLCSAYIGIYLALSNCNPIPWDAYSNYTGHCSCCYRNAHLVIFLRNISYNCVQRLWLANYNLGQCIITVLSLQVLNQVKLERHKIYTVTWSKDSVITPHLGEMSIREWEIERQSVKERNTTWQHAQKKWLKVRKNSKLGRRKLREMSWECLKYQHCERKREQDRERLKGN